MSLFLIFRIEKMLNVHFPTFLLSYFPFKMSAYTTRSASLHDILKQSI